MNPTSTNPVGNAPTVLPQVFWGAKRHEFIAGGADQLLTAAARARVAALLVPINQTTLQQPATWADEIKGQKPSNTLDAETNAFLNSFPDDQHKTWHFVDLPLDVTGYDRAKYPEFTRDDDVVQMIKNCVLVMQGGKGSMSKINALRWLVHLVGDLHQPLHVAGTYIDAATKELLSDPQLILERGLHEESDRGGGRLILPLPSGGGKGTPFHSYWDSKIPDKVNEHMVDTDANFTGEHNSTSPGIAAITKHIKQHLNETPPPAGEPAQWAAIWALDSIKASRQAYQSIEIIGTVGHNFKVGWEGKQKYDARCAPIVEKQMALGSARLALLINTLMG